MMRWIAVAVLFGITFSAYGQKDPWAGYEKVFVEKISVEGNKHTRTRIILRELHFEEGDSIPVPILAKTLELSENQVRNTGLFNEVAISFENWEGTTGRVQIKVTVKEGWYLYPVPRFELADRNFNVWWVEQNRSLDRVNYGLEFTHLNTTGRRDKFNIGAIFGYTQNLYLSYRVPAINREQSLGLGGDISFSRNREVNYATEDNKQAFYKDESKFLLRRFKAGASLFLRPGLRTHHMFSLEFQQNKVDNYIAEELNPDYFLDGRTFQRFFTIRYYYSFENRDVRFYPWSGNYFDFDLIKDGLGVFSDRDALTLRVRYDHHFPLSKRFSFAASGQAQTNLIRTKQAYLFNRAIGFNGYDIRGYEYYVIDGLDLLILKSSLHFFLWDTKLNFGKLMPIKAFREMPLRFYLTLNNDAGIANDPYGDDAQNTLNKQWLWGGGLGLNIVLFYDKVFRLEYSMNQFNERGLFFHLDFNI